jgi:hypothetical protein
MDGWTLRVCAVCLICMSLYIGYGTFLDGTLVNPVLTYWDGSFGVTKSVYYLGDKVEIRMFCSKYRNLTGRIQWSLYNIKTKHLDYFLPRNTAMPQGEIDGLVVEVGVIPLGAESGIYRMVGNVVYSPNSFRDISYHFHSDDFEVVNGKDKEKDIP